MKTFQNSTNDKRLKDKLFYIDSSSISVNAQLKCKRNISFGQFQSILTHNHIFCFKKKVLMILFVVTEFMKVTNVQLKRNRWTYELSVYRE